MAFIKLSDLSNYFSKLPLIRNVKMKLILNLNLGSIKFTPISNTGLYIKSGSDNTFKDTCPLMVSNSISFPNTATEVIVSLSVCKVQQTLGVISQSTLNIPNHGMNNCRLFVPLVKMTIENLDHYLTNNRQKTVSYEEYFVTT